MTVSRTILFTDIVASTELRSAIGERAAERLRRSHFELLRRTLKRHRGREIKNLGDGLMITFASARDAVDCAVAMQRATAPADAREQGRLPIRIGISSGDVALDENDCFGRAVVEASRLCACASPGQVLLVEATRLLSGDYAPLTHVGALELKGLAEPIVTWEATWSHDDPQRVRAVIADDAVLMREGIAQVLETAGVEVVGQAGDGPQLLRLVGELLPDVAIIDVRMPPNFELEGLRIAERIQSEHPSTGVLVLTQELEPRHARRLANSSASGVGLLLKDSVTDPEAFADTTRLIAAGGTAFAPGIIGTGEVKA